MFEHADMLVAHGPLVALALAAFERLAPFVPSYALFIAFGVFFVGDWSGLLAVVVLSAFGSTLGSAPWFAAGAWLGADRTRRWVDRNGRWLFLSLKRYDRLAGRFHDNAWAVVFVAQTIPTVRILAALPAGVIGMRPHAYLSATFLGSLAWNGGLIAAGALAQNTGASVITLTIGIVAAVLILECGVLIAYRLRRRSACAPLAMRR